MGYTDKIEAVRLSILFKGHQLTLSVGASHHLSLRGAHGRSAAVHIRTLSVATPRSRTRSVATRTHARTRMRANTLRRPKLGKPKAGSRLVGVEY